jgi:hypothetical protein
VSVSTGRSAGLVIGVECALPPPGSQDLLETEGFDTLDLKEAKTLLDELHG